MKKKKKATKQRTAPSQVWSTVCKRKENKTFTDIYTLCCFRERARVVSKYLWWKTQFGYTIWEAAEFAIQDTAREVWETVCMNNLSGHERMLLGELVHILYLAAVNDEQRG